MLCVAQVCPFRSLFCSRRALFTGRRALREALAMKLPTRLLPLFVLRNVVGVGARGHTCSGVACVADFHAPFWDQTNISKTELPALLAASRDGVLQARDRAHHSALNVAAFRGNIAGVEALIAAGADVNNADVNMHRPLHHSILGKAPVPAVVSIVKALIAAGSDTSARAKDGKSAMDYAVKRNQADIVAALRDTPSKHQGKQRIPMARTERRRLTRKPRRFTEKMV